MADALALARIRPCTEEDFEAVAALWRKAGLARPWNDPAQDVRRCRASPNAELFVAELGGAVVGSVMAGHDGHRGWVYYLAVDPEVQRNGLGRRLMRKAEKWLEGAGAPKVQLMLRAENAPVRAFYETLGYTDSEVVTLEKWFDGEAAAKKAAAASDPGAGTAATLEVTVTWLEMKARPTHPSFARPRGVALMRAGDPGVAFYRYLYDRVGADWLWYERRKLDDAALGAIISDERVDLYVLHRNGAPAGFAELDRRKDGEIELAYFGLVPEAIGRGLGVWLLHEIVDIAWSYEPERLWLHTCTHDHPRALPLYQRAGFVPYRQETQTIPDPHAAGLFGGGGY